MPFCAGLPLQHKALLMTDPRVPMLALLLLAHPACGRGIATYTSAPAGMRHAATGYTPTCGMRSRSCESTKHKIASVLTM